MASEDDTKSAKIDENIETFDRSMKYGVDQTLQWKEQDPNGQRSEEPGAKMDAFKIPVTRGALHYFPRAITAIAELSAIGANKYSWKGWQKVPDGINRYGDGLGRHELRIEGDYTRRDPDTGVLEATAVAWNALARLELILREMEKK